jgi:hypothetical protein
LNKCAQRIFRRAVHPRGVLKLDDFLLVGVSSECI